MAFPPVLILSTVLQLGCSLSSTWQAFSSGSASRLKLFERNIALGQTRFLITPRSREVGWSRRRNPPSWRFITADRDPPYELWDRFACHALRTAFSSSAVRPVTGPPAARAHNNVSRRSPKLCAASSFLLRHKPRNFRQGSAWAGDSAAPCAVGDPASSLAASLRFWDVFSNFDTAVAMMSDHKYGLRPKTENFESEIVSAITGPMISPPSIDCFRRPGSIVINAKPMTQRSKSPGKAPMESARTVAKTAMRI